MKNSLPKGWVWFNMLDVIDYEGGSQPPKKVFIYMPKEGYVRLIQIRDFGEKPFPTYIPDSRRLKKVTESDLLIARYGGASANDSLGRICSGLNGAYNVALAKVIFPEKYMDRAFVKYLLMGPWFKERLWSLSRSCQTGFNRDDLHNLLLPLAPLSEQHRIACRLDALFEKIETNRQRLARIPQILKRFRQKVLNAAVTGELTDSKCPMIPLGELIVDLKYGTSKKSDNDLRGTPVLRIPNIKDNGRISIDDLKYSNLPIKEHETLKLAPGDILLIRSNGSVSLVGKAALVTERERDYAYAGYLIRVRCDRDVLFPKFLLIALASPVLRSQIEIPARSTSGVNNINSEEIKALLIPTPSLEEQQEIVRRVDSLFELMDKIEARYNLLKNMVDSLPQALLAKAFRGELVPQSPDDEPACILLERIKAERESTKVKHKQ